MSYVFLATPYRSFPGSLDDAWEAAVQAMIPFRRAKIPVVSPIALYHPVAMQAGIDPHEMAWAEMNKPILLNAKAMVVAKIAGYQHSDGILTERNIAAENTIPVFDAPPGDVPLAVVKLFMEEDQGELAVDRLRGDPVDQPSHYKGKMEAIEVIEAFVDDPISAHHGNVLKYAMRWRRKGGAEDLRKMVRYGQRLINLLDGDPKW